MQAKCTAQSASNVVVLVTKLFHRSMPRILTINLLSTSTRHDQFMTETAYGFSFPKEELDLTHFGLFWLDAVQLLFAPLCASPFGGKKDQRTWTPIKHITKRNHLRIKLKLFRRNRISPKMPFCFCYTEWLIEAIALDSERSKQLCRVLLIPLRCGCSWVLAFILSCTGINAAQLSFEGASWLASFLTNRSRMIMELVIPLQLTYILICAHFLSASFALSRN